MNNNDLNNELQSTSRSRSQERIFNTDAYEATVFNHRDPGYRPWLRPLGPRKPTPYEEIQSMMASNVRYAVMASKVALVFAIAIVLDFACVKLEVKTQIIGYKRTPAGTFQFQLKDGSTLNVSKKTTRNRQFI